MMALGSFLNGCDWLGSREGSTQAAPAFNPANPTAPKMPHFAAKAKSVIYLHMAGAPSQLEMFDFKPDLAKLDGQLCPESLLEGKRFTNVNQLWSSDIFYFGLQGRHYYVVLIMDVYSRRIVGYSLADNLRAENNLLALNMALTLRGIKNYENKLIHHSDRGVQYISNNYTELLTSYGIQISMCIDVLENAHMERANGTIKNDYLNRWNIKNLKELTQKVPMAVVNYNNRNHQAIGMTPIEFESYVNELDPESRPEIEIFTIKQFVDNPFQLSLNLDL
jgi:transposase InsO family protein